MRCVIGTFYLNLCGQSAHLDTSMLLCRARLLASSGLFSRGGSIFHFEGAVCVAIERCSPVSAGDCFVFVCGWQMSLPAATVARRKMRTRPPNDFPVGRWRDLCPFCSERRITSIRNTNLETARDRPSGRYARPAMFGRRPLYGGMPAASTGRGAVMAAWRVEWSLLMLNQTAFSLKCTPRSEAGRDIGCANSLAKMYPTVPLKVGFTCYFGLQKVRGMLHGCPLTLKCRLGKASYPGRGFQG